MGQVCTISIYAKDLIEARKFYAQVLGLKVKKELPYLVVLENDGTDLVLCAAEEDATVSYPNQAAVVLGFPTEDLEKSIEDLRKHNVGLIHSSPQDFPGGKFVAFRDPSGNVLELLQFNR